MPSDLYLKTGNSLHRGLQKITFGKVGWHAMGMPVVELTTIGRKSGQERSTMLTSPVQEGDGYALIASRGGDDHHPAWFLNLRDHPDVFARVGGGPRTPMRARITEGEERERLWAAAIAKYKNYAGYQKKTAREIPVVMIEPVRD